MRTIVSGVTPNSVTGAFTLFFGGFVVCLGKRDDIEEVSFVHPDHCNRMNVRRCRAFLIGKKCCNLLFIVYKGDRTHR